MPSDETTHQSYQKCSKMLATCKFLEVQTNGSFKGIGHCLLVSLFLYHTGLLQKKKFTCIILECL